MNRIGVQLYTLRQLLPEEASRKEAYAALQKMGCHTVQLFGGPDQIRWKLDRMARTYAELKEGTK